VRYELSTVTKHCTLDEAKALATAIVRLAEHKTIGDAAVITFEVKDGHPYFDGKGGGAKPHPNPKLPRARQFHAESSSRGFEFDGDG
jgi:hypothetical protein